MIYRDRNHAGEVLASRLTDYSGEDVCVLGLPRGGVVVAAEVARRLFAPLDVLVVRKLGVPGQPEFAFGAIGQGNVEVYDEDLIQKLGLGKEEIERVLELERRELQRRLDHYRKGQEPLKVEGRTVIVVDDGIATGSTAQAAVQTLRAMKPRKIILAAPVSAPDSLRVLDRLVHVLVCPNKPTNLNAVGTWYESFGETSDQEVIELMQELGPSQFAERQ